MDDISKIVEDFYGAMNDINDCIKIDELDKDIYKLTILLKAYTNKVINKGQKIVDFDVEVNKIIDKNYNDIKKLGKSCEVELLEEKLRIKDHSDVNQIYCNTYFLRSVLQKINNNKMQDKIKEKIMHEIKEKLENYNKRKFLY